MVITRSDLTPGYQCTQGMHGSHVFAIEHPEVFQEWYEKSNYLAVLAAKNEHELIHVFNKAQLMGIRCSLFREPDIGDQVTAIVLEPCKGAKSLCGSFPLALK